MNTIILNRENVEYTGKEKLKKNRYKDITKLNDFVIQCIFI